MGISTGRVVIAGRFGLRAPGAASPLRLESVRLALAVLVAGILVGGPAAFAPFGGFHTLSFASHPGPPAAGMRGSAPMPTGGVERSTIASHGALGTSPFAGTSTYGSESSTFVVRNATIVPGIHSALNCPLPGTLVTTKTDLYTACQYYPYLLRVGITHPLSLSEVPVNLSFFGGYAYDYVSNTFWEGVLNYSGGLPKGVVDVYNLTTGQIDAVIPSITVASDLQYDGWNKVVYAGIPLLGDLAILDATTHTVLGTLTGVGGINSIAVDGPDGRVFLPDSSGSVVRILATSNESIVGSIPVGKYPSYAVYDSANGHLFVANGASGNVSVLNASTHAHIASVPVGTSPTALALDPSTGWLYVANVGSGNISVINATTNAVVGSIVVGPSLGASLAIDPGTGSLCLTQTPSGNLTVLDPFALRVNFSERVGAQPGALLVDSSQDRLYVGDLDRSEVTVFNASSHTRIGSAPTQGPVNALAEDTTRGHLLLTSGGGFANNLTIVNESTLAVLQNIPLHSTSDALAYDAKDDVIVVDGYANVSLFNASTFALIANVPVGNGGQALALNASNGRVYAATYGNLSNGFHPTLEVIDVGQRRVVSNASIPNYPYQALFDPDRGWVYISDSANQVQVYDANTGSLRTALTVSAPEYAGDLAFQPITDVVFGYGGVGPVYSLPSVSSAGASYQLPVGFGGAQYQGMAIDPLHDTVYVGDASNGTISILALGPIVGGVGVLPSPDPVNHPATITTADQVEVGVVHFSYPSLPSGCAGSDTNPLVCTPDHAGNYAIRVSVTDASGVATNASTSLDVVSPQVRQFNITFPESGLPAHTRWSMTFNNSSATTTLGAFYFVAPNGSYPYTVGVVSGYTATPSGGTLSVTGSDETQTIQFTPLGMAPSTFPVRFLATGLPSGTSWTVTLNGTGHTSATTTVTFVEPNGTYTFSVASLSGYTVSPVSGPVTVAGREVDQSIAFSKTSSPPASNNSTSPVKSTGSGNPISLPILVGLALAVIAAIALAGLLIRRRRSGGASSASSSTGQEADSSSPGDPADTGSPP